MMRTLSMGGRRRSSCGGIGRHAARRGRAADCWVSKRRLDPTYMPNTTRHALDVGSPDGLPPTYGRAGHQSIGVSNEARWPIAPPATSVTSFFSTASANCSKVSATTMKLFGPPMTLVS